MLGEYLLKRSLLAVMTVIIVSGITFFGMNAIPGGPFDGDKAVSAEVRAVLEERYNLDKPLPQQYLLYMKNFVTGNFGISLRSGREISDVIGECFSISARLGGTAAAIAVVCGVVLGCVAAIKRSKAADRIIIFLSTFATAIPGFVLATLLLLLFSITLKWVPVWSAENPNYILPVTALSLYPMAYITRLTKSSMLDTLGQDYIRTAKAKGVSDTKIIFKHALRNACIPIITYVGPMLAYIITGSLVVETVFTIGGLGSKFISSIQNRDYAMIMAATIFLSIIMIAANLVTDIVYKLVDPRIKLS